MRRAMILGALTPAAVMALTACPAPQASSVGPWSPCTAAITEFFEGQDVPCLPTPPQRLDMFVEVGGDPYGANVRCHNYGGLPSNEQPEYEGWQRCEAIDPMRV